MWDKKEGKDVAPGSFATGTGYASTGQSLPSSSSSRLVNIGQTIFIKGELTGTEDLTIEGRVEGKIELKDHNLTIGPNGKIKADVYAKSIVITGEVLGNAFASERVEITNSGVLKGDITSPRIVIADGAQFKGSVDMDKGAANRESRPAQRPDQIKPIQPVKDEAPAYKNVMPQPVHGNSAEKAR
ncbi:MAG TPA: polymer-forming cytoskeletal protein [Candidatus Polarisedimenticolia bacterium]|jgi:cytoskeletal protein CcmA (bactofilin family)|nr:polymer-forming cytoskeletal protein [Candidatus Polarisedimenticolia bacterium]